MEVRVLLGPSKIETLSSASTLAAASPSWSRALRAEGRTLELQDVSPGLWKRIEGIIYTGCMDMPTADEVVRLLRVADAHELDVVREAVVEQLAKVLPRADRELASVGVACGLLTLKHDLLVRILSFADVSTLCRAQNVCHVCWQQCRVAKSSWVEVTSRQFSLGGDNVACRIIDTVCAMSGVHLPVARLWPLASSRSLLWILFECSCDAVMLRSNPCWAVASYWPHCEVAPNIEMHCRDRFVEDVPLGKPGGNVILFRLPVGCCMNNCWDTLWISNLGAERSAWAMSCCQDVTVASNDAMLELWPCGCMELLDPIHNYCCSCGRDDESSCDSSCIPYHCEYNNRAECPIRALAEERAQTFPAGPPSHAHFLSGPPFPSYVCDCKLERYLEDREKAQMGMHDARGLSGGRGWSARPGEDSTSGSSNGGGDRAGDGCPLEPCTLGTASSTVAAPAVGGPRG